MNQSEYITKEYLDKTLTERFSLSEKRLEKKLDLKIEAMVVGFERHVTDLASGFNEKVKGVCDQVASIDEKLTILDQKVIKMDHKLTLIGMDVFNIKETLKEKTDKKDTLDLKKRIIKLELKAKA